VHFGSQLRTKRLTYSDSDKWRVDEEKDEEQRRDGEEEEGDDGE